MAVAALLAAACGGDDGDATSTTAAGGEQTAASGAAGGSEGFTIDGELIIDQATYDKAQEEGQLTVYTVSTEEAAIAIGEAFTEDTGIEVEVFRAPGSELTQRVLAETGGGVHNFDVVALTSPGDMDTLHSEQLLEPYPMDWLEEGLLVSEEIAADDAYYPLYAYLYLIAVNRGILGDDVEFKSWQDIVKPEYKGKLGITPAGVGGTGLAQAWFQRDILGEDYWSKLGAVDPVIFSTTATVAQSLAGGEISVAIVAESAIALPMVQGAPVELVYPEEGVIGGVSYQAVAKNATHPNAARLYQAWSLSSAGQNDMAVAAGVRPIREGTVAPEVEGTSLRPQEEFTTHWADLKALAADRDTLVAAWNSAVGYTE
jgi:iron(III) transport system substrate-binding protein